MSNLQQLSQEYLSLKGIKGHWEGGEYTKDVDSFNSKKHQAMKTLAESIIVGSDSKIIYDLFGQPDKIETDTLTFMPGPVVSQTAVTQSEGPKDLFLEYYWRGRHDFLYFQVDSATSVIKKVAWYKALE
ncbi:hypothetical protein HDV06_004155 [Boothiomyces sp. JEL0866]|nr:hypothetical protein HDV06_004155 [Boothiomyces sp. JEL0866]